MRVGTAWLGQREFLRKVGRDRKDFDSRVISLQILGDLRQVFLGDIDRDVGDGAWQAVEQQACLPRAAAAILYQSHTRSDLIGHLLCVPTHDLRLGSGQIVFVEMTDLIKQCRAAMVVKVLARQATLLCTETGEHIIEKLACSLRMVDG